MIIILCLYGCDNTTKLEKSCISAPMILLDMEVMAQLTKASLPSSSTDLTKFISMNLTLSLAAILKPLMIWAGCTFYLISSLALFNNSAANITTLVVPSPTSLSCNWLSSTIVFAAGCSTSNNLLYLDY